MNKFILNIEVQNYINANLNADVHTIAMAKSPFAQVSSGELANQIAAKKKSGKKLPSWFHSQFIYYPSLISIEQCSSEKTAAYKAGLAIGNKLIDLTGGFGVDSYYFANTVKEVTHCEINPELSEIAAYNSAIFHHHNINFQSTDGLVYLQESDKTFNTIFIDPARRSNAGKVFMLKDCTPNVVAHLNLLLKRSDRIILKTSPLLDITAGLKELQNVAEVHIVSIKNECKELLFVIDSVPAQKVKIVSVTLNEEFKHFSFQKGDELMPIATDSSKLLKYIYEPDVALLKSGAFNLIAQRYQLQKLHEQTQLYTSNALNPEFPGRIFKTDQVISMGDLKKEKVLTGNVLVRNFPQKAEQLVKKYKIKPDHDHFLIFTQSKAEGYVIIKGTIQQHY